MKSINDLLILECMRKATVLAGHSGLSRNVEFVSISDTPHLLKFLEKNHLLLTSGYPFNNDPSKLCRVIEQMNAMNCTGIVIKMERYLLQLPEEAKLLADRLAFPIIDLPGSFTLSETSHHILNYLNNHKSEQLYYALHIHHEFSEMMIKGYNLVLLVEQLGHFLGLPILLFNHRGDKLAQSNHFQLPSMDQAQYEIEMKVKQNLLEARSGMTFNNFTTSIQSISTHPLQTTFQYPSFLVIADESTLPYPASQLAIEQACNIISFTIIKEQAVDENSRLFKNNFFADFIDGRINSEQEISSRCAYYGLNPKMKTIAIVCSIDQYEGAYDGFPIREDQIEIHNQIYNDLENELINENMVGILFTKERFLIMLLQFPHFTKTEIDRVKSLLKNVQQHTKGEYTTSFGVSNQVQSLKEIPTAYDEAVESINNGYYFKMSNFINFYKIREIKELLNMTPKKHLTEFYKETLKTLAFSRTEENRELIKTIQVYLDSHCNITETSRKLYIHRNTVKYRINKAEVLLNRSFQDSSDSLRIRIALLIGSLLND